VKAVLRREYGETDVLEMQDVGVPTPAEGEVLVRVKAESLDELRRSLVDGEVRSPLTRSYPLAETARAIDDLRAATHPGKLVVVP
jgi:NADPH:quinone reductase-like Zn-dependent oxidoreductase